MLPSSSTPSSSITGFNPPSISFRLLQGQRWLSLVIDCSESMKDNDLPPNRLLRLLSLLPSFILLFFELHPLSQLQIIGSSDGLASLISPMSGSFSQKPCFPLFSLPSPLPPLFSPSFYSSIFLQHIPTQIHPIHHHRTPDFDLTNFLACFTVLDPILLLVFCSSSIVNVMVQHFHSAYGLFYE